MRRTLATLSMLGALALGGCSTGGPARELQVGHIDPDQVESSLQVYKGEFRSCYEKDPERKTGKVTIAFKIGADGRVAQAGVLSTTLGSPMVEDCVLNVIRGISFPPLKDGDIAEVQYPLKFGPKEKHESNPTDSQ